jgi:hypothetical protein
MVWIYFLEPGAGDIIMKPNSKYTWQRIPVIINSHGLCDHPTTYDKPPNTYTWPFLSKQLHWITAYTSRRSRINIIDPSIIRQFIFHSILTLNGGKNFFHNIIYLSIRRKKGSTFVVILSPIEFQVISDDFPMLAQDLIIEKYNEIGIPVRDLLPVYQIACLNKPGGNCELEDRYLYADMWKHPPAIGHTTAAD